MQHQELMIYDFQNYFERFPEASDTYRPFKINDNNNNENKLYNTQKKDMVTIPGGIFDIGFVGDGFSYDNELPEHKVYLYAYEIDSMPVSNGDFMQFVAAGGCAKY